MEIAFAVRCDVGPVRKENQDGFLVSDFSQRWSSPPPGARKVKVPGGGVLLAVADGMGGHRGGREASELALDSLLGSMTLASEAPAAEAMRAALEACNAVVHERGQRDPELHEMGTTLTAVLVRGDKLIAAHVGDSRAYLLRDGKLERLTTDHSVHEKVLGYSDEEGRKHLGRNVLAQTIGGGSPSVAVEVSRLALSPGDTFLLCSDGLHGVVADPELRDLLGQSDIDRAACDLLKAAVRRGTQDNVTVLVARVSGSGLSGPSGAGCLERLVEVDWDADSGLMRAVRKAALREPSLADSLSTVFFWVLLFAACAAAGWKLVPWLAARRAPPAAPAPPPIRRPSAAAGRTPSPARKPAQAPAPTSKAAPPSVERSTAAAKGQVSPAPAAPARDKRAGTAGEEGAAASTAPARGDPGPRLAPQAPLTPPAPKKDRTQDKKKGSGG